jgi:hypothetical protein
MIEVSGIFPSALTGSEDLTPKLAGMQERLT